MAKKHKTGLGKGLGAFGLEPIASVEKKEPQDTVQKLALQDIKANKFQPRHDFPEESLQELAVSIKEYGVLQPVIVRKMPGGYELVAGERRLRAAKLADLQEIPAIVREYSDVQMSAIALIENLQREDLNAIDEAKAYDKLLSDFGLTQEMLAKKIGRSRSHIANFLRLLNLAEQVQTYITAGQLSMGQAKPLLSLDDTELQVKAADFIMAENLSARDAERLVKRLQKDPKLLDERESVSEEPMPAAQDPYLHEAEDKLRQLFGTQVKIHAGKKKSRIEIEFYAPEDLERILGMLTEKRDLSAEKKKEMLRKVSLSQNFSV